ncbi:MAG: hypothetical protein QOG75_2928 [Mycobacterium sp.]|nr:hypothetical protein [Mycobacterium sp.]
MKDTTARRSHTGVRLAIGLSAGTPLLLIGAPSVAADPATDGPAEGQYMVTISDGQNEGVDDNSLLRSDRSRRPFRRLWLLRD